MQEVRYGDRFGVFAVHADERVLDVLIERRYDAIEHVGQENRTCSSSSATVICSDGCSCVCQPVVTSRRMFARLAALSCAVIVGLSSSIRRRTMRCSLRSIVRRVGSVGCAVNTGSMHKRIRECRCTSPDRSNPAAFSFKQRILESRRAGSGRLPADARGGAECGGLSPRCWSFGSTSKSRE